MAEIPNLVQDLALILVVAGIVTLLFKKLKQPLVLGYIVAGFLVSPHMPYTMSVIDKSDVQTWADIGVIFLLFSLGLDFSFKKILKMGIAPVIAALTIIFCMMTLGILTGYLFHWGKMDCIFLGGMLAMSSTTIIYKAFDDLDVRQQRFAGLVMSVLILEDVLAIVLMVMLSAMASGGSPDGEQMLKSLFSIVFFPCPVNRPRRALLYKSPSGGYTFFTGITTDEGGAEMKKVVILIGNYGSGKTEIALNMAVKAAAEGRRTQVIDLDRINDYFRMSDHVKLLDEKKIGLVSPTFVGAGLTQTNMPAAVGSAFAQDWDLVIFDVGGDAAGALSLARYHMDFAALLPGQLEVWDIVNIRRPMSETAEKILKLKADMEGFARQRVTGFIHNSNLQDWASARDLRDGYPVIREASEASGIPVVYTTGRPPFLAEFLRDETLDRRFIGTPLPLELYMKRSWGNFTQGRL